jgi:hypothetical protein
MPCHRHIAPLAILLWLTGSVPAGCSTPEKAPAGSRYTYAGSADFYFVTNRNRPFDGLNALRAIDLRDERGLHLGLANVWVERTREPVGLRLDLYFGPAAEGINAPEVSRGRLWRHLAQAYISVNLNPSGTLYLDLGKWGTPAGAEANEAVDRWIYSPGLLFTYAVPSHHLGARLVRTFNETESVALLAHRGWSAVADPGHAPGLGLSVVKDLGRRWVLTGTYLGGEENDAAGRASWRHLLDLILEGEPSPRWAWLLNLTYVTQGDFEVEPGRRRAIRWYGLSVAGKWGFRPGQSVAARAEWFRDDAGIALGDDLDAYSVTLNYARVVCCHVQTRVEYRHDFAGGGKPLTGRSPGGTASDQGTWILATVVRL